MIGRRPETPGNDSVDEAENEPAGVGNGSVSETRGDEGQPAGIALAGNIMARRTRGGEEWMLTYMDTITLLLTLFVILMAFSTLEDTKFTRLTESLDTAKYGTRAMLGPFATASLPPAALPEPDPAPVSPVTEPAPAVTVPQAPPDALAALRDEIGASEAGRMVKLSGGRNTVELAINERLLFDLASADITGDGETLIGQLVPMFQGTDFDILVEGHTDSVPISTDLYPSNWELSAARASSVARELITGGVKRERIRVVGYADTKPAEGNDTPEGRRANRRVTIVIRRSENPT